MLQLKLALDQTAPLRILCLGAHSDDIEIGCGGTMLRILREYRDTEVHWVVLSARGDRLKEAEASAARFLAHATQSRAIFREFRDGFFPYIGGEIKTFFEELKDEYNPDLIFTHYRMDLHQDHRLVCELTWNTFRNHLILEYEVVKYDGDLGTPNSYVHLDASTCGQKVRWILESFRSQQTRAWFAEDTFYSILRLRGLESNAPESYAEAFHCRKAVIG